MSESVTYQGKDLEAMSFAENYHRWILEKFAPHLGPRVVEVGAGTGSFSELLLERPLEMLALVEPSAEMHARLTEHMSLRTGPLRIRTYNALFRSAAAELRALRPDSVVYVNVLEHVLDDEAELDAVSSTLGAGGRLFVFVPALRWLYGGFDERVGHHRRYSKAELEGKCRRAGFRLLLSSYFDCAGVVPWWVKYRLLGSDALEARAVRFYDRHLVPAVRRLESIVEPPLGKNVVLVAERI